MPKEEITSYYDANIKSKLIEIVKKEVCNLETTHINDVEELYFMERNGAFSDFTHWRKKLKTDNDFIGFVGRLPNFYNRSKLKRAPGDTSIIHFNLKWNDFASEQPFANIADKKKLSYFEELKKEFANELERDSFIINRVEELKSENKWGLKLDENGPQFGMVYEASHTKTHRDFMLDEVVWLATDFHMEKRWKRNVAKKLAYACKRAHKEREDLRNHALQMDLQAKKQAKSVAKLVSDFWSNINKIQQIKIKKYIEFQKQQELNERLKNFVDKTQQYSSNIANKLTTVGSTSTNTSENDFSGDDFDPSDINEDSDQLEEDMKEFIDEENTLDNDNLFEELNQLDDDGKMSLDDLISNLPQEYLDEYRKNTENYGASRVGSNASMESHLDFPATTDPATCNDTYSVNGEIGISSDHVTADDIKPNAVPVLSMHKFDHHSSDADVDDDNNSVGSSTTNSYDNESTNIERMVESANRYKPTGTTVSAANCKLDQPFLLRGTLREYQLVGLNWLLSLHDNNLNGILADEMGLGKTIQTIALIAHLAGVVGEWGPHLIIVPSSVILNWECEFKKWCPSLKVLAYYGRTKERKAKRHGWSKENAFHVCITSFQLAIQDNIMFKKRRWYYLIIDEAHNIRNSKSVRWNMLLGLNTQRRLLLTGTPLQNNLMELWSLLHFLMPHLFKCEDAFRQWFAQPISSMVFNESSVDETTIMKLHQILRPFILRRLKCEVELQIPKKYEHVIKCELSPRQRALYNEYMMLESTQSTLQTGNFMSVMQILIQLRKVCNHPDLFEPRPVVSPFIGDPPAGSRFFEVPSLCDFSQSHLSFLDEFRMMLLDKHPPLKAHVDFVMAPAKKDPAGSSRKRKINDTSPVALDNISITSLGCNSSGGFAHKPSRFSVDYYVKRFTNFIDAYVEQFKKSPANSTDATPISKTDDSYNLVNGNHHPLSTPTHFRSIALAPFDSSIGLADTKKNQPPKLCHCTYNCDGCGIDHLKENLSVPNLRAVIEDQPYSINKKYIHLLKKQATRNITRILKFSKLQQHSAIYNSNRSFDLKFTNWCNGGGSGNKADSTGCLNSLCSVSSDLLHEYVPYAIREVLISAMRAIAHSFQLLKYADTSSLKSIDNFLVRLSNSIQSYYRLAKNTTAENRGCDIYDAFWKVYINRQLCFPQTRLIQYDCGKLQFLDDFLKKLFREGHRVLIFTQMSKMLDILEKFLAYHHFTYLRLDGSTKIEHRQYMMDLFNNDDSIFTFILSTRAGGLGLNLTGADTVIFYDNDWNPTVDAQAQDRCHRIGQIRDVHIYRLVCRNTVEENILKRAQQKRMLADVTIEGGNFTVSQLEENFISDIFGQGGETEFFTPDPQMATPQTADTVNLENVLKCVEKIEGIDDADLVLSAAASTTNTPRAAHSSRPQPSAYDDFCEEIIALENDMLPVERFALYYLESVLTEALDQPTDEVVASDNNSATVYTQQHHHSNDQMVHTRDVDNQGNRCGGDQLENDFVSSCENNKIQLDSNGTYFRSSATLCETTSTHCDTSTATDENIQFENFVLQDIEKMSADDCENLWLPRGTNCFSILNDVYDLDSPGVSVNAECGSPSSPGGPLDDYACNDLPLTLNEGFPNSTTNMFTLSATKTPFTPPDTDCAVENDENCMIHYPLPMATINPTAPFDQGKIAELVRWYLNPAAVDADQSAAASLRLTGSISDKLKVQDLCWLTRPNFYDHSLTDQDIDYTMPSLNQWNESYYYADNLDNLTTELFFQDEGLSLVNTNSRKHLDKYLDVFEPRFSAATMNNAMATKPKSKSSRAVRRLGNTAYAQAGRDSSSRNKEKCFATFTIVWPRRLLAQLCGVMIDVLDSRECDSTNLEFFRHTFFALSQQPYSVSRLHLQNWSATKRRLASRKCDKILNNIASSPNKSYVRTKNHKHQRVCKDVPNLSGLSCAAISKYSNFGTKSVTLQKDTQIYNNKRISLNRIHDRIRKKHRLMNLHSANQISAGGEGTTSSGGHRRIVDQNNKYSSSIHSVGDKIRSRQFPSLSSPLQPLPCLFSSLRKRRTLLESNVMMYNQDKIAKVKQHVSRISINDHLLLYRDLGSKVIKHVKLVDGKFVKVPPTTIPPAAVAMAKIGTGNNSRAHANSATASRPHLQPSTVNTKAFGLSSAAIPPTASSLRSQFSSLPTVSTSGTSNQLAAAGYQHQNVSRTASFQRLSMPKTATISMTHTANNQSGSGRLASAAATKQHKPNISAASGATKNTASFKYNSAATTNNSQFTTLSHSAGVSNLSNPRINTTQPSSVTSAANKTPARVSTNTSTPSGNRSNLNKATTTSKYPKGNANYNRSTTNTAGSSEKKVQPSPISASGVTPKGTAGSVGVSTPTKPHSNSFLASGGNNARTHAANNYNRKIIDMAAVVSPHKLITSPASKTQLSSNVQRAILLQQQQHSPFNVTPEKPKVSPEKNQNIGLIKRNDQQQQIPHPTNHKQQQQYHAVQTQQQSFHQTQQQSLGVAHNSPLKANYNQHVIDSTNIVSTNTFGYVDNSTGAKFVGIDPGNIRATGGRQSNLSSQFNHVGSVNTLVTSASSLANIPSAVGSSTNTSNVCSMNMSTSQGNRQTISACPSNPQLMLQQQKQQTASSLQNLNTTHQNIIHRLGCLQQQLGQLQQQHSNIPSQVFQQLQQQNLLAQQQLQQQLIQLQQQHQAVLGQQSQSERSTNPQSNISYEMVNNPSGGVNNNGSGSNIKIGGTNLKINNDPNSMHVFNEFAAAGAKSVSRLGNNNNSSSSSMILHQMQPNNQSTSVNTPSSVVMGSAAGASDVNLQSKHQADALTVLNSIIHSGGNVPVVLQQILRGNPREHPGSNNRSVGAVYLQNNNSNNNISNTQASTPSTMNLLSQQNVRHYLQQALPSAMIHNISQQQQLQQPPQQQQPQGINPNNRMAVGGASVSSLYHNVPISQPNAPVNLSLNHPSYGELNNSSSSMGESCTSYSGVSLNQNAFKNIPQNELFNLFIDAKSNANNTALQQNYAALQQLLSKAAAAPKLNSQPNVNNRGGYGHHPNNQGYPTGNP